MSGPQIPRLLFVHAHPDDESITTGGTIAHYVARGADVRVVTCTLGEEGEVIGDRYQHLSIEHADQLGGYRISELTAALSALGVDEPRFLGGPGRWRDSGMAGTAPRRQTRFIDAGETAVRQLTAIVDEFRPHVVVTYDPGGGYGHPDHIHTHDVTTAAVEAAPWRVPKVYWTVFATSAVADGLASLADIPVHWTVPGVDELNFVFADERIDAVIDVSGQLPAKTAALVAHATQVVVAPDETAFALSNNVALPILGEEHYILAAGAPGPRDGRGWEVDLLAGLNLG